MQTEASTFTGKNHQNLGFFIIIIIDGWMTSSVDNLQMEPPFVQVVK